jgi:GNAT superfamily N-acetyltransferase
MFILVETKENIKKIAKMSKTIWHEAYQAILDESQIDYMLDKYLSKEAIKDQINAGYQYFIIKDDKPCGFASIRVDDKVFLSKIYVLKDYRKKGLLRAFIDKLKDYNKPIYLTVNKYNKDAIKAYESLGFVIKDSIVTDIGQSYVMDDYVMEFSHDI